MRQYMTLLKSYSDSSVGLVPPVAQALYFRLFLINNRAGWTEWFGATNQRLMLEVGLSSAHTLIENRNLLKRLGFIDFKQGKKGQPTLYRLNDMCEEKGALNALNTAPQTALESASNTAPQTAHIYRQETMTKTKTKRNTKEKALASLLESYTDNADLLEALRGFVEMRKEKGGVLTERALQLSLSKLDKLSTSNEEKIAIVNESVMREWKTFYPLKKQEVRQHGAGRDNSREVLEARYPDFVEADRNHVYPWEVQPPGGGDRAASG
nr:MAG TPA: hypothetical protein [Caudoviricetes sp.]